MTTRPRLIRRLASSRGQGMVEMAMVLPILTVLVLGVVEVSYALLDQHVVTKLTREGSNLISRDTSLGDAGNALKNMSTAPINFNTSSKVIFSVIKSVSTAGAANFGAPVLYQRYSFGAIAGTSALATRGAGSFGGAPDYTANNSDNDTSLQVTNLPAGIISTGGMLYVTEIFTKHELITPFDKFGITVPSTMYSISYF